MLETPVKADMPHVRLTVTNPESSFYHFAGAHRWDCHAPCHDIAIEV